MDKSTRTSEGLPFDCRVCGKQMIVTLCTPLGDAVCPHCGTILYPHLLQAPVDGDDEKRLSDLGILVETDDRGEVVVAQLNGPRFNDASVARLAGLRDIPLIKLYNTGLTPQGIERLRSVLPNTTVEEDT
jgi:hypothetical protein